MAAAANYTARKVVVDGFDVLRLTDAASHAEASIVPAFGNNAYKFKVGGRDILWSPFTLKQLAAKPAFVGNPFMAPWANRLDQDAFHANGRQYLLNPGLRNFLRDPNGLPIHGLLAYSRLWRPIALEADANSARATCRLEFWRHPDLMAQFPFAHALEVTHRLQDGVLEVETLVENHSTETMPVSLGYHPYFQIHDAPRTAWKVHLPARDEMVLSAALIPTGKRRPLKLPDPSPLEKMPEVYVLSGLSRGPDDCAEFWVEGGKKRITVKQGPKYDVAVFYAPRGKNYLCFEPMAATINALNPMKNGRWHPVQSIVPGGTWRESFWIHYEQH